MLSSFFLFSLRQGITILTSLLIYKIISIKFSIKEFGEFNYILTASEVALLIIGFGIPEVVRRKVARESSALYIRGYIKFYIIVTAIGSFFFAILLYFLVISSWSTLNYIGAIIIIFLFTFFSGLKKFFIGVYESLELIKLFSIYYLLNLFV